MRKVCALTQGVISITALVTMSFFMSAPSVSAAGPERTSFLTAPDSHEAWAIPATPEIRARLWAKAFQQFIQGHPSLSADQRSALESAMNAATLSAFDDNLNEEAKGELAFTLLTIRQKLSPTSYRDLVTGFQGLRSWLEQSDIEVIGSGTCTCNGAGNCAGGRSCVSSGCTAEAGTTNWGTCG